MNITCILKMLLRNICSTLTSNPVALKQNQREAPPSGLVQELYHFEPLTPSPSQSMLVTTQFSISHPIPLDRFAFPGFHLRYLS